ncbi:diguanylate cyclase [Halanaerobacter jeridensis]|uniref:Diguanylate cyclase (GGDEF)-like protein/PAS domain S-box-containing protein n=1 Tax=Halanaerobacter jeridensis TaxID=706427 RepID=A0A939BQV0_9FIRM|nr:diguanylate cyclase (GGDEF)-like protein/PAS domain S-box-containing protein [Halanaerobacter jeridensis]
MIRISYNDLDKEELVVALENKDEIMDKLEEKLKNYQEISLYKNKFIKDTELGKIFKQIPAGLCITNDEGYFELVNPAYCEIYGYSEQELLGQHFSMVATEENKEKLTKLHDRFITGKSELRGEWEVEDKEGQRKIILADAVRIQGPNDNYKKVTFVIDITERKKIEEKLKQANQKLQEKAVTDGLTGLYNHKEIIRKLKLEVERATRYNLNLAVMMADIDDFKDINDSYGHQKGDEVLENLAQQLKNMTRQEDIIGRYGGEEFIIVFPHTDVENAFEIGERIRQTVAKQTIADVEFTISIGIADLNSDSHQKLIKDADLALYQAKNSGKNKVIKSKK